MKGLTNSKRLREALGEIGILSPLDAIEHLPYRYESLLITSLKRKDFLDKMRVTLFGKILTRPKGFRFRSTNVARFLFEAEDGETYSVDAWNRFYLAKTLLEGEFYTLSATYNKGKGSLSLISITKGKVPPEEALKLVYSLPSGIPNHIFSGIVRRSLEELKGKIPDIIPLSLKEHYRLPSREEAFRLAHFPRSLDDLHSALRLFKYEEALLFEMRTLESKRLNKTILRRGKEPIPFNRFADFLKTLPYSLTADQMQALKESLRDMASPHLMYRLLQGDVGSGKTLVASLLCYAAYLRGEQSAFMAPTDALARQHYESLKALFKDTDMNVSLLVGAMSGVEKRLAMDDAENGSRDLFVGTHALFSKNVHYANLGFAVIDEQHKFGVNQRTLLAEKGDHTDLLMMSATPIPRSLTQTLYGDLDVSTIHTFPFKKREVEVRMAKNAKDLSKEIDRSLEGNGRVYVVVPEIEEKEGQKNVGAKEVYLKYKAQYGEKVGLLHGKMSEEEKILGMSSFKSGRTPILVATSLIEVGLDVPSANLMIFYHPSHFSLSSLHQLRGRVGRDGKRALCLLVPERDLSEEGEKKLEVFMKEEDGFKIAEWDLKLRGPGDVLGTRQSGIPQFSHLNIVDDYKIFLAAKEDAERILEEGKTQDNAVLYERLREESKDLGFLR